MIKNIYNKNYQLLDTYTNNFLNTCKNQRIIIIVIRSILNMNTKTWEIQKAVLRRNYVGLLLSIKEERLNNNILLVYIKNQGKEWHTKIYNKN